MSKSELVLEKLGVATRRQGGRVWAERCPLPTHGGHNEAHAWQNFFARVDRGVWSGFHCFSCKGGGNLVELAMLLRGVDFAEALAWVRDVADAEPEEPFLRVRSELARLPGAITLPEGVEKQGAPLETWNSVAREYVLGRGITDEQVRRWRIGYALVGRLEGRVFLPIYDRLGRLANYAARSFVDHEKRYLAAGSWESPDKNALFGEHRWAPVERGRPSLRDVVVVFEGALNGLALERAVSRAGEVLGDRTIDYAGMSGLDESEGGAIDVRTLMKLATFPRVVVATDPDGAGDRAAAGLERALRRQSRVARLELPPGWDAADVWRSDPATLQVALADAVFRCAA